MKFSLLYEELKFSDVFIVATPEEIEERKKKYGDMKIKEYLDHLDKTKLPDDTWHVHDDLNLKRLDLFYLNGLNVSIVDGDFNCSYNNLNSLKGAPKEVRGDFYCNHNDKEFNLNDITSVSKVKGFAYYI